MYIFDINILKKKMETQEHFQTSYINNNTLKASVNIISRCDSTIATSDYFRTSQGFKTKNKSKLPSYVFDIKQPNPQQKLTTDKFVEKLKAKQVKKDKQPSIRKTELGENQLVFTNQEVMKLQVIDEFLEKGFDLPEDPFHLQLFPTLKTDDLDIEACNKQSNHPNPFQQQIENFVTWGDSGNKQELLEILDDRSRNTVSEMKLNAFDKSKLLKKRKQVKILSFVKKGHNKKKQQLIYSKGSKYKKTHHPSVQIESSDQSQKLKETGFDDRALPSLNKTITGNKVCSNFFKRMDRKQKITQLTYYMNEKYLRVPETAYMTAERIQALYNCDMIKGVKQIMSNEDYMNLRIALANSQQKKDKKYYENHGYTKRMDKEKEFEKETEEIQQILQKNKLRLKKEKQRVIEKLRC